MNHFLRLPERGRQPLPAGFLERLGAVFGARCSTAAAVCEHHGRDESPFPGMPPDAVVFAHTHDEVVAAVEICAAFGVPVVPYGVGSSLEGNVLPVAGGLTIDLSQMNRVLSVNPEDLTVTVQAGVTRKQLNAEIKDTGLFFPIDPGADASIGGMAATRASGTNAVRYGTMRENVVALTVVTAAGKTVRTARRAKKSSAGYDLTRLFVGSEGTLGVITEITVRLYPLPEAVSAAVVSFPSVDDAVRTVIQTIQMGVPIARAELLDALTVKAVNAYSKTTLREAPLLLFEFHGSPVGVQEQAELVQEIATSHGGADFEWASTPEERTRLWNARHMAYFAMLQLRPGCRSFTTDVCVPISRLAQCITQTMALTACSRLPAPILGHVGDGNFHCTILADPNLPDELDEAERLNAAIVASALAADGTCTGEHGVGLHKMDFLVAEHGDDAIDLMRAVKHALDPHNLMNPGKVLRW